MDKNSTVASPLVRVHILTESKLAKLKQVLTDRVVEDIMPEMINAAELYMDETLDLRRTIHDKMSLLTPLQFEELFETSVRGRRVEAYSARRGIESGYWLFANILARDVIAAYT